VDENGNRSETRAGDGVHEWQAVFMAQVAEMQRPLVRLVQLRPDAIHQSDRPQIRRFSGDDGGKDEPFGAAFPESESFIAGFINIHDKRCRHGAPPKSWISKRALAASHSRAAFSRGRRASSRRRSSSTISR
jgi:hypothetical protein